MTVWYRYRAHDLLTDAYIADLELADVSYSCRIGEPGTFSATIPIPNPTVADRVATVIPRHPDDLSTGPGRTVIHVYRNGVIWGSYILWAAEVSMSGEGKVSINVQGASLESYLARAEIRSDLTYTSTDQIEIARQLLTTMQSTPRYDIGLTMQAGTSGVLRDRMFLASEAASYGQRIAELADTDGGFEWVIRTSETAGVRTREWVWGYPRLGSSTGSHVFTQPGRVLTWSGSIDATNGGTAFLTRGENVNEDVAASSAPLLSDVTLAQDHLDAGWPGLDATVDYSSVRDQDTLNLYAAWLATHRAGAVRIHQATVRLDADTSFTPDNLGDYVRLMLVNDWWPRVDGYASFSKSWRVIGMDIRPPSRDSDHDEATLIFQEG